MAIIAFTTIATDQLCSPSTTPPYDLHHGYWLDISLALQMESMGRRVDAVQTAELVLAEGRRDTHAWTKQYRVIQQRG
jgi:hypothetical protein